MKIYTKTGDDGGTSLVGGRRISKSALRLECYGTVDELNSSLGVALSDIRRTTTVHAELEPSLTRIQNELFQIGSLLACDDSQLLQNLEAIEDRQIQKLEAEIDRWTSQLAPLKNFILPGGSSSSSLLHWARTVCRRAERLSVRLHEEVTLDPQIIRYLNRLSDFLFVAARMANHLEKMPETLWKGQKA